MGGHGCKLGRAAWRPCRPAPRAWRRLDAVRRRVRGATPIAGDVAFWLFALGILGTGMLALPVLAGSAAEAVASYFHLRKGLDLTLARGRSFYAILAAAMLRGGGISLSGLNPISAL